MGIQSFIDSTKRACWSCLWWLLFLLNITPSAQTATAILYSQIVEIPLEQVVLKVKLLEPGLPAMILQLAMQPPGINDIKRIILKLKGVGALTDWQNGKINPFTWRFDICGGNGRIVASLCSYWEVVVDWLHLWGLGRMLSYKWWTKLLI